MNGDNWQTVDYFQGISMNSDFSGVSVPIQAMDCGSVQVVWTSSSSSRSKFHVEASLNNEDWCAVYPDSVVKRSTSGNGCAMYTMENISWPYIRVRYERVQSNTGTLNCFLFFKRKRSNNP